MEQSEITINKKISIAAIILIFGIIYPTLFTGDMITIVNNMTCCPENLFDKNLTVDIAFYFIAIVFLVLGIIELIALTYKKCKYSDHSDHNT